MKLKNISFVLSFAGLGLMLGAGSAQALTWNFNYNYNQGQTSGSGNLNYAGSGDGTFSINSLSLQENGVNGTYTLDNSSLIYNNYKNFIGDNNITISNGQVTKFGFFAANSLGSSYNYGRALSSQQGKFLGQYSTTSTGPSYGDLNASFTPATASVPWNFSPEQGVVLGLPLFISFRMLKKRSSLKNSTREVHEMIRSRVNLS